MYPVWEGRPGEWAIVCASNKKQWKWYSVKEKQFLKKTISNNFHHSCLEYPMFFGLRVVWEWKHDFTFKGAVTGLQFTLTMITDYVNMARAHSKFMKIVRQFLCCRTDKSWKTYVLFWTVSICDIRFISPWWWFNAWITVADVLEKVFKSKKQPSQKWFLGFSANLSQEPSALSSFSRPKCSQALSFTVSPRATASSKSANIWKDCIRFFMKMFCNVD